jgi:hypothetical protein
MFKKGDVINDPDDDEDARTSALQNRATAILSTENSSSGLSIYSSPLISSERWGGGEQEINGQRDTYRGSHLGFSFQPDLHTAEQV